MVDRFGICDRFAGVFLNGYKMEGTLVEHEQALH